MRTNILGEKIRKGQWCIDVAHLEQVDDAGLLHVAPRRTHASAMTLKLDNVMRLSITCEERENEEGVKTFEISEAMLDTMLDAMHV